MKEFFKKIVDKVKAFFKKADGFREALEDKLADCLEDLDGREDVDEAEKELVAKAIEFACNYYGVKTVPAGVTDEIGEAVVEALGKLNRKVQDQLRK